MIEGLKLSMSSEELKQVMAGRINYHQEKAGFLSNELERLRPQIEQFATQAEQMGKFSTNNRAMGGGTLGGLEQELARHTDKATLFRFMVEHIIPSETYILDENDLRKLEVLPSW